MKSKQADAEFLTLSYKELLGRSPDKIGFGCFLHSLIEGKMTREDVINEIKNSNEYRQRRGEEKFSIVAKCWDDQSTTRDQNSLMGWLDSPFMLRNYVQPTITGEMDVNWLIGISKAEKIPASSHWISFGCGAGGQELYASQMGLFERMDAYDLSESSIEIARRNSLESGCCNIDFKVADFDQLANYYVKSYDVLLMNMALHHVRDLESVIASMRRIVKSNGWILLNEYVGPSQMQFSLLQQELVQEILSILPDDLKYDYVNKRTGVCT